ncbi:hypothetical protein Tco_0640695 [Tanacetum coccineum]
MSTLVFVDPESSTQADGYEAIRQAYLDGTDTESEPFKDPIDTETPESPLATAPPVPLSEKVAAMSESALLEDSEEEDEEIEESMDSDNVSEDAEDEGPTAEDADPTVEDEGLIAGVEGPGIDDESYGLDDEGHGRDDESLGIDDEGHSVESDGLGLEEEEEAIPGGRQQEAPVVGMTTTPIRVDYWFTSISPSHYDVPLPISLPMIPLTVPSPVATPATIGGVSVVFERYDRTLESYPLGSGAVREGDFLPDPWYRFRSLEYEKERVIVKFEAIWRPGENRDLWLQLTEERHTRLELAEVVDSMRRDQEPKGGA